MIAACNEVRVGVDNLWKRGASKGRLAYPDFGQYMPINMFKAWQHAASFCWCDKEHWYKDKRDRPWEVFLPALDQYNGKRRKLLKVVLLLLDESMSGWRPKTSKLGGAPNLTYEPRKPVSLGTMFRNGVECISGIIVNQDVVQPPEVQARKKYQDEPSALPNKEKIPSHVAEVLRQAEDANVVKGGWVGGDSWFGSVMTCIELYKKLGLYSTFIVKTNTILFPQKAMFKVLKARHGVH